MATPRVLNLAGGQQVYNKEKVDELVAQLAGDIDPATLADNVMRRLDAMDQTIADALSGSMPSASDSDIDGIWED